MLIWVGTGDVLPPSELRDVVVLRASDWNDWWKFSTLYSASYMNEERIETHLGLIKIGQFGLLPPPPGESSRRPSLPELSEELGPDTFSLGQEASYYERVAGLGQDIRDAIHKALKDVAFDLVLFERALHESVMLESLLREVSPQMVRGQFSRIAHGGATLTPYDFQWTSGGEGVDLEFSVRPDSMPPTNVHALIGRNGVGKSTLLHRMARYLVNPRDASRGRFASPNGVDFAEFNNVVSVSFSAFDAFEPIQRPGDADRIGYSYIGLNSSRAGRPMDDGRSYSESLLEAVETCLFGSRRERWVAALEVLENDPIFRSLGLVDVLRQQTRSEVVELVRDAYPSLSSGHKIVLLGITSLVAAVEEKTLVLIDEPEAHLHPPLLSAYVRALSSLMVNRNGVAIVATHSPVVLQEVPRTCVWKMARFGNQFVAERPELETFGENVGTLTSEVFALEVTETGFHRLLAEAAKRSSSYEGALGEFRGQVGFEGRAILRARVVAEQQQGRL